MPTTVDTRIHLLENYGTGGTTTLCGIRVPALFDALWRESTVKYAVAGEHTCSECDSEHKQRMRSEILEVR